MYFGDGVPIKYCVRTEFLYGYVCEVRVDVRTRVLGDGVDNSSV